MSLQSNRAEHKQQKDPDAGKDWSQKEKWVAEDEMVREHHRFNEHEFEETPEDSKGQRPRGARVHGVAELDTTYNWTTTTAILKDQG